MAKKINPDDIVNMTFKNKINQTFKVIKYIHKESDYIYEIMFLSGNVVKASRRQIINLTIKDKEAVKLKSKKTFDYKKKNKEITQANKIFVASKKNTVLLSLDQSSSATGWCVISNDKLIDCGVIQIKSQNTVQRIAETISEISTIIKKYNVTVCSIEDIYLGAGLITYKVLAMLMGALLVLFYGKKVDYTIITAPEWKSHYKMLGTGKTREVQKQMAINKTSADSDDLADSLLIGAYTWNEVIIEDNDCW